MSEWTPGPDGILERRAARIIAFDSSGSVLLMRGHDAAQPGRSWWFTVGGGITNDDGPKEGAVREFFEETGVAISPDRLVGPVITREAVFHFAHHDRRQFEEFFLVWLDEDEALTCQTWNTDGLTELEKDVLDELAWLSPAELDDQASQREVFPVQLPDLVRQWGRGWDGRVVDMFED